MTILGRLAFAAGLACLVLATGGNSLVAADAPRAIAATLKDHRFDPAEIHVKAGQPSVIDLHNEDSTAEEFDSAALGVEKVIAGGRSSLVRLHALDAGRYPFMGEYHSDTAQGVVIAE